MKQLVTIIISLFTGLIIIPSCNKPSEVGLDVFDGQQANVKVDTFAVKAKTQKADFAETRSNGTNNLSGLLCGNYNDPFFGKSTSDVYMKFLPVRVIQDSFLFNRNPESVVIDSVVLSLAYRQSGEDWSYHYGDVKEPYQLEVYKVMEQMDEDADYTSDQSFSIESIPFLTKEFVPAVDDSIVVTSIVSLNPITDSMAAPQLRLTLDNSFAEELLFMLDSPILTTSYDANTMAEIADPSVADQEEAYLNRIESEFLYGLCFKIVQENNSIINIDPLSPYTAINIFFKTDETFEVPPVDTFVNRQLTLAPDRFYHVNFNHDYTGSVVEPFIDDEVLGDSLLFLQGLQGLNVAFEFPDIETLDNVIVNKATLEFDAIQLPGDNLDNYAPTIRLLLARNVDGEDIIINDVVNNNDYGGSPVEITGDDSNKIFRYTMNLSGHFQRIVNGSEEPGLKLIPIVRAEFANRNVFAGNKFSGSSPKLIITYTDLN